MRKHSGFNINYKTVYDCRGTMNEEMSLHLQAQNVPLLHPPEEEDRKLHEAPNWSDSAQADFLEMYSVQQFTGAWSPLPLLFK